MQINRILAFILAAHQFGVRAGTDNRATRQFKGAAVQIVGPPFENWFAALPHCWILTSRRGFDSRRFSWFFVLEAEQFWNETPLTLGWAVAVAVVDPLAPTEKAIGALFVVSLIGCNCINFVQKALWI